MRLGMAGLVLAVVVGHAAVARAAAITITSANVGDDFTVLASGLADPGGQPVSARLDAVIAAWTVGASSTTLVLDVTLTNTTALTTASSLRGYGFSANPDVVSGSATGTAFGFDTVSTGLSTNNSVGNIENCVADQAETECTGLSSGGLASGQVDTHTLTLLFSGALTSLQLGDTDTGMYFRFQAIGTDGGSAKIFGNPPGTPRDVPGDDPPAAVPEPGSLLLLGSGLAYLAHLARTRMRRT